MRLAWITQEEPFYLPPALADLSSRSLAAGHEVVAMIVLPAFDEPLAATAKRLMAFYGPVDFARLAARYAAATAADRANRFVRLTRPFSAADVARRYAIPLYRPAKANDPAFVAVMRDEIRPDLLASIAASQVLKRRVLQVPRLGCINLHSAPLPRYQGMMPNFWTLLHEEPHATVTVHRMVEALDAGDILLQKPVPIAPNDSLHDLMVRSKRVGVEALLEAVAALDAGTASARPMNADEASYFSFPTRTDALRLRRMGRALL